MVALLTNTLPLYTYRAYSLGTLPRPTLLVSYYKFIGNFSFLQFYTDNLTNIQLQNHNVHVFKYIQSQTSPCNNFICVYNSINCK